jgi:hypothetical protein
MKLRRDEGAHVIDSQWSIPLPTWRRAPGDIVYADYLLMDGDTPTEYRRIPLSVFVTEWSPEDLDIPVNYELRGTIPVLEWDAPVCFAVSASTWSSPSADDPDTRRHPFEILLRTELLQFMSPTSYDERVAFITMDEYKQRVGPEVFALETEP